MKVNHHDTTADWYRLVPHPDSVTAAFRMYLDRIGENRTFYVYRSPEGAYVLRRNKLKALSRSPDNVVWLFKRSNEKPIQISGKKIK